jgi:transposase-like protein
MKNIANNMDKFVIDESSAMKIYRSIRWKNGLLCPYCGSDDIYNRGSQDDNTHKYSCNSCRKNFNDFTNTIFAYSKIPFGKLLYILINIKFKSVLQLSKELDLHRNTVGRYRKRIHDFLLEDNENISFDGDAEMDETYITTGAKGIKKPKN